jgi:hypothetical protein
MAEIMALLLCGGLEGDGGEKVAKIAQPLLDSCSGDEIYVGGGRGW